MQFILSAVISVCLITQVLCHHLFLGNITQSKNVFYHTVQKYRAIPFVKRVKNYFFVSPKQTVIRGISAFDRLNTVATAIVTAGGLGYTYVNIRLKSERGYGLLYEIKMYK